MKTIIAALLLLSTQAFAQTEKGQIINQKDKTPVPFAKIGIPRKGIGTVADENGAFSLPAAQMQTTDTLRISCIGFQPYNILVSDFKHIPNKTLELAEKPAPEPVTHELSAKAVSKKYGVADPSHAGFISVQGGLPGSEAGVVFNFKQQSLLQTLSLLVDSCTVDTIFMRINVYKVIGEKRFENILNKPIYFKKAGKSLEANTIVVDLSGEDIWLKGQYLVCIEPLKTPATGFLRLTGKSPGKTFVRKTSFATWRTAPVTMSMVIEAKIL